MLDTAAFHRGTIQYASRYIAFFSGFIAYISARAAVVSSALAKGISGAMRFWYFMILHLCRHLIKRHIASHGQRSGDSFI